MSEKDICRRCPQQDKCRDVYDRMGNFSGQSVFFGVIQAFLLPLVIFVASLAIFEKVLANSIESAWLRVLTSFTGAGCLLLIYALIAAMLGRRAGNREKGNDDRSY